MNQNIPNKEKTPKDSSQGFAITSLVIGVSIIVVMLAMAMVEYAAFWTMVGRPYFPAWLYLSVLCVIFAGLICGIIGLKSNRKRMAIAGITICSLISIPYIYITCVTFLLLVRPWAFP